MGAKGWWWWRRVCACVCVCRAVVRWLACGVEREGSGRRRARMRARACHRTQRL